MPIPVNPRVDCGNSNTHTANETDGERNDFLQTDFAVGPCKLEMIMFIHMYLYVSGDYGRRTGNRRAYADEISLHGRCRIGDTERPQTANGFGGPNTVQNHWANCSIVPIPKVLSIHYLDAWTPVRRIILRLIPHRFIDRNVEAIQKSPSPNQPSGCCSSYLLHSLGSAADRAQDIGADVVVSKVRICLFDFAFLIEQVKTRGPFRPTVVTIS